jgi:phosphoribosylformylglycinamidine synthase subunit PurSL
MADYLVTVRSRHDPNAPQHLYLLDGALSGAQIERLAGELLHDSVTQAASWCALGALDELDDTSRPGAPTLVEVAYKPGVTDNEAETIGSGRRGWGSAACAW